ncbi:MAG: eukaryotic-like serine/threonine-protein kinase [Pyrinomonadaceae bacterium]|jgi:serine/threonine protein kinase/tetratricopeptide (TPR) repeat protein|nr:eukaryotic-like serine/threonine-protein kinase [Pyrinomonadaceae bacterium]
MENERISHYRILEKLGAGGMGEVYLAEDTKLGRKVALKILGEEYTTNRDRLHRFEQEACAASALNHPNILTIHEVGNDDGRHFIATEYIDGVTLRRKISGTPMDVGEILDIAVQVAGALEEAHSAGIIHRDIKPDNIMIRRNGYVKVLDFGLAKLTERSIDRSSSDGEASTRVLVHTDAGVVMGTSHYMSPEQARGKPVDARSDIWSLGVVLYEMVAGRTPFEGETSTDVLVSITQKEAPPLARFAPNVPAELDWIITKALRKDRDERYQTIKELITDLRRLKQKTEFEAELERSVSPDTLGRSTISASGAAPTISDRVPPTAEQTGTHTPSSAEYIVSEIKRHKTGAGIFAALFVVLVGAGVFFYFHRAQALTDKDTVLLADFVNTTGEPVFDGTLKQALAVQLGQSPFLNIYPDERVREALRFMGRSSDDRVTRDVAREIGQRQGLKAMLAGSISSLGSHYVLTLEAINVQSGDAIAREQGEADSKEQVLSTLGRVASQLREKLGESLGSIKKFDAPIEQATTSSLEALKAFSQGNDLRQQGHEREAIPLYKRAVEIDPNFALAYARVAVAYNNWGETELAKEYSQKAYDLRDRVSEREKFYISEKYHSYVTGNRDEAIKVLKTWTQTYPNDYIPHNNLAVNYNFSGQFEEALREAQEAMRLSPTTTSVQGNLVEGFIRLGRIDEAKQLLEQTLGKNSDRGVYRNYSFTIAFLRGDEATMKNDLDWFASKPTETDFFDLQAGVALSRGQVKKALELNRRSTELLVSQDRKENASQNEAATAFSQAVLGRCSESKQQAAHAITLSRGKVDLSVAALDFALCGDTAEAQALADELLKRFPQETISNGVMIPLISGAIENNRGKYAQALEATQPAVRFELGAIAGFWVNYLRGQAYLGQHSGKEAVGEFQKILDHRTAEPFSPIYALAHLGLARATALSGDTAKSRTEYQNFFAAWKDADADLPVLVQAKKEYEQLK